jgi:hypothetical protein
MISNGGAMDSEYNLEESLKCEAQKKYNELHTVSFGSSTGRRLELAGVGLDSEKIESIIVDQFIDIARRLGVDFFRSTPAVVLEQFTIMAIQRNEDTAGLLKSLINSFMLAYLTPESSQRAFEHLTGLEGLRAELATRRGLTVRPLTPHPNPVKH